MERLAELIGKLKEQFEQKADHSQLLVITQMIQEELHRSIKPVEKTNGSSKVSVMMPASRNHAASSPAFIPVPKKEMELAKEEEVIVIPPVPKDHEKYQPAHKKPEMPETKPAIHQEPILQHIEEQVEAIEPHPPIQPLHGWHYDPVKEIPTLAHQETFKELNEVIGIRDASLNDKLKAEVVEVGHRLNESPIRDLKRAIGVNDRYTFINELFRGDEAMYERSLKTINAFRIYAEAEYWIERELKVKLGWEENKPATRQFYQLVRRRFT